MFVTRGPPGWRRGRGAPGPRARARGPPARCAQTLSATIVPPPGASTASRPSTCRTTRSSGPTSTASPVWTTRPVASPASTPAFAASAASSADQLPRSLQPTSIAPITTRWSAAAPSITAWSIEIGLIRSYAAAGGRARSAIAGSMSVISGVYFSIAARIAPRRHANMPAFQATPGMLISSRARCIGRLLLERDQRVGADAVDRRRRASCRGGGSRSRSTGRSAWMPSVTSGSSISNAPVRQPVDRRPG